MRNLILFGLLIVLLLVVQFASAKTIDEVIENYERARGGRDKLAALKSILMEGTREMKGGKVAVRIIKEQDRLSRTEIETVVGSGFVLVTDKGGWTFFPDKLEGIHKIQEVDLEGLQIEMDIAGPLSDYLNKGHKAELQGKEIVEGNSCYKIKITTKTGKVMMFWVDASTYLVHQSVASPIGGLDTGTITIYKNYIEVDGIQLAHSIEIKNYGMNEDEPGEAIFFHKILANPIIHPDLYLPV